MEHPAQQRLNYAAYLEQERLSDVRLEFIDGVALAMAGGTLRHSRVKIKLSRMIDGLLDGTDCMAFDSDAKVRVPYADFASYPDLSVVCGTVQTDSLDRHAMTNPILLVEVLSDGTEAYDRGEKFRRYRMLESLKHYVLVSLRRPLIEHYARQEDGSWLMRTYGEGQTFLLEHPSLSVDLDALYADLPAYEPQAPRTADDV